MKGARIFGSKSSYIPIVLAYAPVLILLFLYSTRIVNQIYLLYKIFNIHIFTLFSNTRHQKVQNHKTNF